MAANNILLRKVGKERLSQGPYLEELKIGQRKQGHGRLTGTECHLRTFFKRSQDTRGRTPINKKKTGKSSYQQRV